MQPATPEMVETLRELRKRVAIGFVSGSDFPKIKEQLGSNSTIALFVVRIVSIHNWTVVLEEMDYCLPENGLTAYKMGKPLPSETFITFIGEERYKTLVNFILHYIADLDIPIKRGTFVEFRRGMINVSPIGRNATIEERNAFEQLDKQMNYRKKFVEVLREKFPDYGLTFSIGGKISFDVFPNGWDKTYALRRLEDERFEEIHFFGDRCIPGGNDYEIYADPRTIGHAVTSPADTIRIIKELFLS
ncbi:hypothetical protein NP233_g407 [Leucocoprinus birnbaumii]|uniref:Phosphomannomutase n=1 Tax=Leucocoprinus birnbaumii TaxID=56174 RepID=A0AAD5W4C7_9AGAR|nr:hypothetical protein NP233_g407 [Leucocoprinus birnbaumii]